MISSGGRFVVNRVATSYVTAIFLVMVGLLGVLAKPAPAVIDIWVDPGHGGRDPGALGYNGAAPYEKTLNLAVAGYLVNDLIGLGYDATYMTRNSDTTNLSKVRRWKISNGASQNDRGFGAPCRLFVSVHMNSVMSHVPYGTLTRYAGKKYEGKTVHAGVEDAAAADTIQQKLMTYANAAFLGCSDDRGLMIGDSLTVLGRSRAPAVLIECCYISNGCQWNHIITSAGQSEIAYGIATGVSHYLQLSRLNSQPPRRPEPPKPIVLGSKLEVILNSLDQDFEGGTFPPTGWTIETAGLGLPYGWQRTIDSAYVASGSGAALVGGESPSAIDEWLISPGVSLASTDRAIKFSWSGSQFWSSVLNASLSIRQVGTSVWTRLWSIADNEPPADPFIYRDRVVDLSAWTGKNVEFGFRVTGTNGADFALDDIVVGDFAPTVAAPNDVCANATRLGSVFSIQGVTCYAANDLNPYSESPSSCVNDELAGPDVFYEIGAGSGDSLHVSVTAEWGAALYLVDNCVSPVCLAGGLAEDSRTAPVIDYKFSTAGGYYLVVDGEEGSCGPYQLDGQIIHTATGVTGEEILPPLNLDVHPNPAGGPISLFAALPVAQSDAPILEIYNVAGKRVLRLEGAPGGREFSFVWDRRDRDGMPVASGVYFARLQVGGQSVVQKFVILR